MKLRSIGSIVTAATLSACGMHSSNIRMGNEQSLMSLKDQHDAAISVREYVSTPAGARVIGRVDAARCHRYSNQSPPTEASVLADLKDAAYAKGANGITDVAIVKKSGITLDCWHILDGTATAIAVSYGR